MRTAKIGVKLHPMFTKGIGEMGVLKKTQDYLNLRGRSAGKVAFALAEDIGPKKAFSNTEEEKLQIDVKTLEQILKSILVADIFEQGVNGVNKNRIIMKKIVHPEQLDKILPHVHLLADIQLTPLQSVSRVTKVKAEAIRHKHPLILSGNLENGSTGETMLNPWSNKPTILPFLVKNDELLTYEGLFRLELLSSAQGVAFTEKDAVKRGLPWFDAVADEKDEYPDFTMGDFHNSTFLSKRYSSTALLFNGFLYEYKEHIPPVTNILMKLSNMLNKLIAKSSK